MAPELAAKRMELLKEGIPRISCAAVLWFSGDAARLEYKETEAAARKLGVTVRSYEVRRADDAARALEAMSRDHPKALGLTIPPSVLVRADELICRGCEPSGPGPIVLRRIQRVRGVEATDTRIVVEG